VYENVAGKEGQFDLFAPILPTMDRAIHRKKAANLGLSYLFGNSLFMVGPGVNGVPPWVREFGGESALNCFRDCSGESHDAAFAYSFATSLTNGERAGLRSLFDWPDLTSLASSYFQAPQVPDFRSPRLETSD